MAKKKATDSGTATAAPMKKTEAVRQAVAAGKDNPTEGAAYIKEKFGLEVTTQQFSTYKSVLKAKEGKGGKRSPAAKSLGISRVALHQKMSRQHSNGVDMVDAASAVKGLCNQIGAGNVKRLAGLFE